MNAKVEFSKRARSSSLQSYCSWRAITIIGKTSSPSEAKGTNRKVPSWQSIFTNQKLMKGHHNSWQSILSQADARVTNQKVPAYRCLEKSSVGVAQIRHHAYKANLTRPPVGTESEAWAAAMPLKSRYKSSLTPFFFFVGGPPKGPLQPFFPFFFFYFLEGKTKAGTSGQILDRPGRCLMLQFCRV